MSSITSAIDLRGLPNLAEQLLNDNEPDITAITEYEHYEAIFKIRHDLVHALICDCRQKVFGERPLRKLIDSVEEKRLSKMKYYSQICDQTPDIMEIKGKRVEIIEITVTIAETADAKKYSKYSLLVHFLRDAGYEVSIEVIVINPDRVYLNRPSLIQEHKLTDVHLDKINEICKKTRRMLQLIRSSDIGKMWALRHANLVDEDVSLNFSPEDVLNLSRRVENGITYTESDLIELLQPRDQGEIQQSDEAFLDHCLTLMEKVEPEMLKRQEFDGKNFIDSINKLSTTREIFSIFPLPYVKLKTQDATRRSTMNDREKITSICSKMQQSDDPILSAIASQFLSTRKSDEEDYFFVRIKLSKSVKREIAIEGPGRKEFIREGSIPHIQEQAKKHMMSYEFSTQVDYIVKDSYLLSTHENITRQTTYEEEMEHLSKLTGPGLDYVKICQSIYREININSLRKQRGKKYILRPTGVEGVFVLIFPGAKLRVGEVPSQIWFKIIVSLENLDMDSELYLSKSFKRLSINGPVGTSRWLSVDAHRLDHFIRCYDKIIMAYSTILQCRYRSDPDCKDLRTSLNKDDSNVLGLIIMTYMEDKRSTSKTLQISRYLVMTSLSVFPYYNDVMAKVIEPIRSPLQLYYIKKMCSFIPLMKAQNVLNIMKHGDIYYDQVEQAFNDSRAGSQILLPKLFVDDPKGICCEFSELLSEMYFCMLFNKDQDDPTHAAMQILTKMLEGESNLKKTKSLEQHLGYKRDLSDMEFATELILNPKLNQFSKKAIEIGSVLQQAKHGSTSGVDHIIAAQRKNINKTVDEFATYKSSAKLDRDKYDPTVDRQNTRRRCVEGVISILDRGLCTSFQVAEEEKNRGEGTHFHIFKKNQIGGPREILILTIERRIIINILETFCRNLCKKDSREMLTHGDRKNESVRACLFEARKFQGKRGLIYLNFDKSKWGPTFNPCQFLYMFTRFSKNFPKLYWFIMYILIQHTNKTCIYPEKLIDVWRRDPDNLLQHRNDKLLQSMKEKFLDDDKLSFMNESNMGQGILHYTSSFLHLCMISFRDELYDRALMKLGVSDDDHRDLVSSDDSFTVLSYKIKDKVTMLSKLTIFLKCQEISERLFNCRTSLSKSSISAFVGEFNSLFFSNLHFYPTTIKFAIASVHPVSTDSFFRMVKESYISSRQLFENGGTLELYYLSQLLNRDYAESIYHTYNGGVNDPEQLGIRSENSPYQIGKYPIFNPSLMISFGPEFHNYQIYKRLDTLNKNEKQLLFATHKIVKGDILETLAELEGGDTVLGGLLRIEAKVGPTFQLEKIKSKIKYTKEDLDAIITEDPLILLRRPKTCDETYQKTVIKLFQKSASEALRNTAASIYFGRMSATVSAEAFVVSNQTSEKRTYFECLKTLLEEKIPEEKMFIESVKFLYPKWREYDSMSGINLKILSGVPRNLFETMSPKKFYIYHIHTKLFYYIHDIINFFWNKVIPDDFNEARMFRDWAILQKYYPMLKSTLEETKEQFSGTEESKTKSLVLLLIKLQAIKDHTIKAINFGSNTTDIKETISELSKRTTKSGYSFEMTTPKEFVASSVLELDKIFWIHNLVVLSKYNNIDNSQLLDHLPDLDIFFNDPKISRNIKKRVFMICCELGKISNLFEWSEKLDQPIHQWVKSQTLTAEGWIGPYELIVFQGLNRMNLSHDGGTRFSLKLNKYIEPELLYRLFEHASQLLQQDPETLFNKLLPGQWFIEGSKIIRGLRGGRAIQTNDKDVFHIGTTFQLNVSDELTQLLDDNGRIIMRCQTGILPTRFNERVEFNDFVHKGLQISKVIALGCFAESFDLLYKSRKETLATLDDIKLEIPTISDITQKRLNLRNYQIYNAEDVINELCTTLTMIDRTTEEKKSLIEQIKFPDDDMFGEVKQLDSTIQDDPMEEFFNTFSFSHFMGSLRTVTTTISTRSLWYRLEWLKYKIISHQMLNEMQINIDTLMACHNLYEDRNLFYALLKHYDLKVTLTENESPKGLQLTTSSDFKEKFSVKMKGLNFE